MGSMTEERTYRDDSSAVQAHLGLAQSLIQRMASNSSSCKTWCITLVAAILVAVADKGKPIYALIATVPTVLFLILDAYYLALERCSRTAYNQFVSKLHGGTLSATDLYVLAPDDSVATELWRSLWSVSIVPFYLALVATIGVCMCVVIQ